MVARSEEERVRKAYARRDAPQRYSFFNAGQLFILQEREREVLRLLKAAGHGALVKDRILEVGCGTGFWLREFVKWGSLPQNVVGVELLAERAREARMRAPTDVKVIRASGGNLPFRASSFDIVLQASVLTSVLDFAVKRRIAGELLRVLRPQGLILWYDFFLDNPKNPDVKGIRKSEVRALFPGCDVLLRRTTLAPLLARALAPWSWLLCHMLSSVRLLRTYYLGVIRKRAV